MTQNIHATAVIDPQAELDASVTVGPYAVIGPGVRVGADCEIGSAVQLAGPTVLGRENRLFPQACVGFDPQDLKYEGEKSDLIVGDGNTFREFCTVHRGTSLGGGLTRIGDRNLFMAYTHVAHDCRIGDRTIFGNSATLAGHVEVGDDSILSAFSAVHQFCRLGRHAFIGGYTIVTMDALPYARTVGQKPVCLGLNRVGLERRGFDEETIRQLDQAMRIVSRLGLSRLDAVERLRGELGGSPHVDYLVEFISSSDRGVIRTPPGKRGSRGGRAG